MAFVPYGFIVIITTEFEFKGWRAGAVLSLPRSAFYMGRLHVVSHGAMYGLEF